MTDFFAQSLQAFQERMRTPWIGSSLIAFLLWNWQPLLFLFASDTALPARFAYFDAYTDWRSLFVGLIATGFFFAAAKPWISLLMDKLGAQAIHRSRLHADRLAADRRSKQLEQQQNLAKEEGQIENEVTDQVIERIKKIDEAQLDQGQKEQVQQKLRALQPTPDEEDVDPIDEETRERVVLSKLDEDSITVLRELARLENGIGQLISSGDGKYDFVDPFSKKIIHKSWNPLNSGYYPKHYRLGILRHYKLVTGNDHDLCKITKLGRKVASLSEVE
jgi:hypothetical protein